MKEDSAAHYNFWVNIVVYVVVVVVVVHGVYGDIHSRAVYSSIVPRSLLTSISTLYTVQHSLCFCYYHHVS